VHSWESMCVLKRVCEVARVCLFVALCGVKLMAEAFYVEVQYGK
jgi:hypothetical protein